MIKRLSQTIVKMSVTISRHPLPICLLNYMSRYFEIFFRYLEKISINLKIFLRYLGKIILISENIFLKISENYFKISWNKN